MEEPGDSEAESSDESERRIARARASIGRSYEQLISRTSRAEPDQLATQPEIDPESGSTPRAPADEYGGPSRQFESAAEHFDARVAEAIATIETRIGEWVQSRVGAAERRLALQSNALEAALGEEAVEARTAGLRVEAARLELEGALQAALAEVTQSAQAAGDRVGVAVVERAATLLREAEARVGELGSSIQADVAAAGKESLDAARIELRDAIAERIEETRSEFSRNLEALGEQLQQANLKGDEQRAADLERISEERAEAARMLEEVLANEMRQAIGAIRGDRDEAIAQARAVAERAAALGISEVERTLTTYIDSGQDSARREIEALASAASARLDRVAEEQGRDLELELARRESVLRHGLELQLERAVAQMARGVEHDLDNRLERLRAKLAGEHDETTSKHAAELVERTGLAFEREVAKAEVRYSAATLAFELVGEEGARGLRKAAEGLESRSSQLGDELEALAEREAERLRGVGDVAGAEARLAESINRRLDDVSQSSEVRLAALVADSEARIEAALGAGIERAARARVELEERVSASAERAVAERAAVAAAGLQSRVDLLSAEIEAGREELSRRSIKAERRRLVASRDESLAAAKAALEAQRDQLTLSLREEASAASRRIAAEIEGRSAQAQAELESASEGIRERVEEAGTRRGEQAVTEALAVRTRELGLRLEALNIRNTELVERRLAAAAEVAEQRIASVDRAQVREEEVRRRTDAARAEAEGRVRAAEQRLVEVLADLDLAQHGSARRG